MSYYLGNTPLFLTTEEIQENWPVFLNISKNRRGLEILSSQIYQKIPELITFWSLRWVSQGFLLVHKDI